MLRQEKLWQGAAGVRGIACISGVKAQTGTPVPVPQTAPPPPPWLVAMPRGSVKTSLPAHAWPLPASIGGKQRQRAPGEPKAGRRWTWGSSDLLRAETPALHRSFWASLFSFLLSSQEEPPTLARAREKRDYAALLCLERTVAAGTCWVCVTASPPAVTAGGGGDPRGRTPVPGCRRSRSPVAARSRRRASPPRAPPGQTWRSSTLCSTAGAWQRPPSPLPEGYTKAGAARGRIMPL